MPTADSPLVTPPADQVARDAIIAERARNVAVIAGAGTGKTRTIIERAVELLAPRAGTERISIKRLAALTFTRRAAGELRFRLREQLLRELEHAQADDQRVPRLRDALSNLDAAFIGTIHGFADRLLRLRPVEAKLSPAYALVEDNSELVRETFSRLRRAAEAGSLRTALAPYGDALDSALIADAGETLRSATRAGLQMERTEGTWGPLPSVEAVLASMIDTRDVDLALPDIPTSGVLLAREAAIDLAQRLQLLRRNEVGHRRLRRLSDALNRLHEMEAVDDAAEAFRIIQDAWRGSPIYKRDFDGDSTAWGIYRTVHPEYGGDITERLRGPHRWLAARLVRLFPILRAMYERVKDEHEVVDYLDLLVKLRDVLRNPDARRFYQGLFDHVFIDEFQDTDPLQCEIVFFLCEDGSDAVRWDQVKLAPGKLTIVGDPKQSIYRFRRADIVMYEHAMERLRHSGAFEARLDTNFRSRPELIDFFNAQLGKLLGRDQDEAVDAATGRAIYEDLAPDARLKHSGVCVHLLPYTGTGGAPLIAEHGRPVEARMIARYLRWLLGEASEVRDPDTGESRPLRPGDVAVLACVTTNLPLLLTEFETLGIEYSARGGTLFLSHPVARQYLLALRALADRNDGVARAALLRPPFFALDCGDMVADMAADVTASADTCVRLARAKACIGDLRERRLHRSPGATARDLIERTGLGRTVVTGRNGRQMLAALYEIAWELDRRAALDHLDYDQATALTRSWAEAPVFLDAPEPLGGSAVHVMSIHQAKGLEFPVVVLWDGFQTLSNRGGGLWQVARDGTGWALSIGTVAVEQPPEGRLIEREKQLGESERRRMYYVAATRARDLLALPLPLTKSDQLAYATKELAAGVSAELVRRFPRFDLTRPPPSGREWPAALTTVQADSVRQGQLDARAEEFARRCVTAAEPLSTPIAVTALAQGATADENQDAEREGKVSGARYGAEFGVVVHRAMELMLSGTPRSAREAVTLAAAESCVDEHLLEAVKDVDRALAALRDAGISKKAGWQLLSEYPVCNAQPGKLLVGFIDLLAVSDGEVLVIDFKSDLPHAGHVARAYPTYAHQLNLYGDALQRSGRLGKHRVRLALLLTAVGELRWLDS